MKEQCTKREYEAQRACLYAELYQCGATMVIQSFERLCRKIHGVDLKIHRLKEVYMSRSNKNIGAVTQSRPTGKQAVCCRTCAHGPLHRYGNDPLLASCLKKPQEYDSRFPYQVEVANCLRSCSMYAEATEVKEVEQRERVA